MDPEAATTLPLSITILTRSAQTSWYGFLPLTEPRSFYFSSGTRLQNRVATLWVQRREILRSTRSAMGKRVGTRSESALTRAVESVFAFVRFAEFEILFFLFFVIAYIVFKDITSRPEYNQILVKKPGGIELWPY